MSPIEVIPRLKVATDPILETQEEHLVEKVKRWFFPVRSLSWTLATLTVLVISPFFILVKINGAKQADSLNNQLTASREKLDSQRKTLAKMEQVIKAQKEETNALKEETNALIAKYGAAASASKSVTDQRPLDDDRKDKAVAALELARQVLTKKNALGETRFVGLAEENLLSLCFSGDFAGITSAFSPIVNLMIKSTCAVIAVELEKAGLPTKLTSSEIQAAQESEGRRRPPQKE